MSNTEGSEAQACIGCAEDDATAWNEHYPVNTAVRYWTGARFGDGRLSTTRSTAQVLGGHTAVVWVEGQASCIALTHVQPVSDESNANITITEREG